MTTSAPDQGLSAHGTMTSSALAPAQPSPSAQADLASEASSDGSRGLVVWWAGLSRGRRWQLLGLQSGEPLPQSVVGDLRDHGVLCPLTLVHEGGRVVRRSLPPALLLDFLARERAAAGAVVVAD